MVLVHRMPVKHQNENECARCEVAHTCNPSHGTTEAGWLGVKASLGYMVKPCLNKPNQTKPPERKKGEEITVSCFQEPYVASP